MAVIIRSVFGLFWAVSSAFVGFLAYIVLQTEHNPQLIWAWLVMCGFTFISATWLAYNIIFGHQHRPAPRHHDLHLEK